MAELEEGSENFLKNVTHVFMLMSKINSNDIKAAAHLSKVPTKVNIFP